MCRRADDPLAASGPEEAQRTAQRSMDGLDDEAFLRQQIALLQCKIAETAQQIQATVDHTNVCVKNLKEELAAIDREEQKMLAEARRKAEEKVRSDVKEICDGLNARKAELEKDSPNLEEELRRLEGELFK